MNRLKLTAIDRWLDAEVAQMYQDQPLAQDWARISKVAEELGEAIQAFIGYTGQNPRKGTSGSLGNVLEELADTAISAILAMIHLQGDSFTVMEMLDQKVSKIHDRVPQEI